MLLVVSTACPAQTVWYVDDDATAGRDGTSWPTAFTELQSALALATAGDEIRVAGGLYRPDFDPDAAVHTGDRHATFVLTSGARLYGGYAGVNAFDPDARDVAVHVTILTGDLAGDDGPAFAGNADNSYHVVTASDTDETTVLDGVTITAGNADGDGPPALCFGGPNTGLPCTDTSQCDAGDCISLDSTGAGVIAFNGRAALHACTITANFAAFQGAGMMLKAGSDLTMTDCTFTDNRALDNGGAIYAGGSSPTINGCSFAGNSGARYAGALCLRDLSNATIVNTSFVGNTAAEQETTGGGAIVNASSSPTLNGCVFEANVSFLGRAGAIYNKFGFDENLGPSAPLIEDCTFTDNVAATGGAVFNDRANPTITNCTFTGNDATAGEGGGAIWNDGGRPLITGCGFTRNIGFNGGGVYSGNHASPVISDCVFTGNAAINDNGGGVSNVESDALITGSTFIDNTATGEGFVVGGGVSNYLSNPTITHCVFVGNSATWGGGGLYNESGGDDATGPVITHCTFTANVAAYGAGMYNFWSSPTVANCLLSDNLASAWGGGMYNDFSSSPEVSHCTFAANTAVRGGGVNNENVIGSPALSHCIVWGNAPEQITDDGMTPASVSYCSVQGGWPGGTNMDDDPSFADPAGGEYRLRAGSACIDAGDPAFDAHDALDLDGNPRQADGDGDGLSIVDLGAYEFSAPCPADIDRDGAVNLSDLEALIAAWGPNPGHPADLDDDGTVGITDFLALIGNWGTCP